MGARGRGEGEGRIRKEGRKGERKIELGSRVGKKMERRE